LNQFVEEGVWNVPLPGKRVLRWDWRERLFVVNGGRAKTSLPFLRLFLLGSLCRLCLLFACLSSGFIVTCSKYFFGIVFSAFLKYVSFYFARSFLLWIWLWFPRLFWFRFRVLRVPLAHTYNHYLSVSLSVFSSWPIFVW